MGALVLSLIYSSIMIGVIVGGLLCAMFSGEPLNDTWWFWTAWTVLLPIFGWLWGTTAFAIWDEWER